MGSIRLFPCYFKIMGCSQSLSFSDRWSSITKTLGTKLGPSPNRPPLRASAKAKGTFLTLCLLASRSRLRTLESKKRVRRRLVLGRMRMVMRSLAFQPRQFLFQTSLNEEEKDGLLPTPPPPRRGSQFRYSCATVARCILS